MAKGVTLSIRFTNMDKLATIEAVLKGMDIQYLKQEYELEQSKTEEKPVEQPKKAEKKSAPKKDTKKGSEDFNYELYKSIAEQLGVYGKHGCYKFARPTVKGLIQHPEYLTKAGKLKANVKKSSLATLLTEAQKLGLQWYIDNVAESKAQ